MATHSSLLAWKIPWTEEPDGLQSTGSRESDTTEQPPHVHSAPGPHSSLLGPHFHLPKHRPQILLFPIPELSVLHHLNTILPPSPPVRSFPDTKLSIAVISG